MEALVVLVIIGIVVGVVVAKNNKKKGDALPEPKKIIGDPLAAQDGPFWKLKAGDLVKQVGGPDFLVRRSVTNTEGGYKWHEHLLDDAQGARRWMSVEDEDGLDLGMWQAIPAAEIENGRAGDKQLVVQGLTFALKEEGSANYATTNTDGSPSFGTCEYFQYEASDGKMLAFQSYDKGNWEASIGDKVRSSDFEVFPSGGVDLTEGEN